MYYCDFYVFPVKCASSKVYKVTTTLRNGGDPIDATFKLQPECTNIYIILDRELTTFS